MIGQNQTFVEGVSINIPPLFVGKKYPFQNVIMQIFPQFVDMGVWDVVINGPYIPMVIVNNIQEPKDFSQWTNEENRRAQYDVRGKNIISSTLTVDEFYKIYIYKSAREMWDKLEVTHESTHDVERVRKNILIQE